MRSNVSIGTVAHLNDVREESDPLSQVCWLAFGICECLRELSGPFGDQRLVLFQSRSAECTGPWSATLRMLHGVSVRDQ